MVVHRMHPTWICYVNFGQLMFYDNQEQKVRNCSRERGRNNKKE